MSVTSNLDLLNKDVQLCSEKLVVINRRYCIEEYGQRYHRFFNEFYRSLEGNSYVFNGAKLQAKDLADSIAKGVNEEEVSELTISFTAVSFYKQLSHVVRNQKQGQIVIFRAHELNADTARLLDQLAYTARKHDLDWSFILVGDPRKIEQQLPGRFKRAYHIPNQTIKSLEVKKRRVSLTPKSWLAICVSGVLLLGTIFILKSSLKSGDDNLASQKNVQTEVSKSDDAQVQNIRNSSVNPQENRRPDFQQRLNEWEGLNAKDLSPLKKAKFSLDAGLRMSAIIEEAFVQRDSESLLQWFQTNPVDVVDNEGQTALIRSLSLSSNDLFKQLLSRGATFNRGDMAGRTPLIYASIYGNKEAVSLLLDSGADPNKASHFNKTALMAAVHNSYSEISRLLLERSADPNIQDNSGWTALFYAAWNQDDMMQKLLIQSGADINIKDTQGTGVNDILFERSQSVN